MIINTKDYNMMVFKHLNDRHTYVECADGASGMRAIIAELCACFKDVIPKKVYQTLVKEKLPSSHITCCYRFYNTYPVLSEIRSIP